MGLNSSGVIEASVRDRVRSLVLEAGFDRVGFAAAGPASSREKLKRWVERGFAGSMAYIEKSIEKRADVTRVLAGARTVITAAVHYTKPDVTDGARGDAAARGRGLIAAYAGGEDYHRIVESRLRRACLRLGEHFPASYRYHVDSGPVLERDWAEQAGVGWIGKNTCAIDPERGSFFFLGVILTTLELDPDAPSANHCGSCRLCIDACPTGSIVAPYELDARLCISYLTIEHRGSLPEPLEPEMRNHLFGCDICQEVCPFNRPERSSGAGDRDLAPRPENENPALEDLVRLDEAGFRERFPRSAVRRAKFEGFLRNVIVALGNWDEARAILLLDRLAVREDIASSPVLMQAVERARKRARTRAPPPT